MPDRQFFPTKPHCVVSYLSTTLHTGQGIGESGGHNMSGGGVGGEGAADTPNEWLHTHVI